MSAEINVCCKQAPADYNLLQLYQSASICTQCSLNKTRSQIVFADGNPSCKLMLVGEAPGYNEDKEGIPFIGRAGQLLNRILNAAGIDRKMIYLCNVVKCYPGQGNPTPTERQIKACLPFLREQIVTIKPLLIIAAGNPAAYALGILKHISGITKIHGKEFKYNNIPVIATTHPAALLRGFGNTKKEIEWDIQLKKQLAWKDWQFIAKRYHEIEEIDAHNDKS